jgi:hypothetical protein
MLDSLPDLRQRGAIQGDNALFLSPDQTRTGISLNLLDSRLCLLYGKVD